jgi:hypothetical protein
VAGGGEAKPVAEARRGARAERSRTQPREQAAQGIQVGSVHGAEHERTAADGATLPFELGDRPRSYRRKDSNLLVFAYQAGFHALDGDGRVWAYAEAVQGEQRGDRVLGQAHSMPCPRRSSLKAPVALRNNSGPLKPE